MKTQMLLDILTRLNAKEWSEYTFSCSVQKNINFRLPFNEGNKKSQFRISFLRF